MTGTAPTKWAVDTSVAVAALDESHEAHSACRESVLERRPALAGHAAFEVYSVLTRLPGPLRLDAGPARLVIRTAFPEVCWPQSDQLDDLLDQMAATGLTGGSVYDGLVALAARANGRVLLTRDRRAERTYEALGVRSEFV